MCIDNVIPQNTSKLLSQGETCVLCGLSVYSSEVLHRHYLQKHIASRWECSDCGERFTQDEGADVLDHILCLARVEEAAPLREVEETWHCPSCGIECESKNGHLRHLTQEHSSDLRGEIKFQVCEKIRARIVAMHSLDAARNQRETRRSQDALHLACLRELHGSSQDLETVCFSRSSHRNYC